MRWMAPEVMERPYDAKSDTWAIGCLVLELCTCHLYEANEVKGKLFEIKHNDEALDECLRQIGKVCLQLPVDRGDISPGVHKKIFLAIYFSG